MSEIIYINDKYRITKYGSVYILSYFDEHINDKRHNRNKKIRQSRVTKNYDFIKKYIKK